LSSQQQDRRLLDGAEGYSVDAAIRNGNLLLLCFMRFYLPADT
jgi:hypothetical protein